MGDQINENYFRQLNQMLRDHDRSIPFLLVDLDRLDKNIDVLKKSISRDTVYRIVLKSLPSLSLVDHVMQRYGTNDLMVFHQPFLTHVAEHYGKEVDVLMGKPMPVKTAKYFYDTLRPSAQGFDPYAQVQWLVDTTARVCQYIDMAKQLGKEIRLNIEIDVGLHRGGFDTVESLHEALQLIQSNSEYVSLSGLMGYDPHIVKLPSIVRSQIRSLQLANDFYDQCKSLIKNKFPLLWSDNLTFNGAGSPTINLHIGDTSPLNDISAGSCLVKPTTFDIPTLDDYVPASYIATPVLKKMEGTQIPGLEKLKSSLNLLSTKNKRSYFVYGGFWKADYCYPKGASQNSIYSASTNQTMVNISPEAQLEVDDFVFLRPHQSEFVFLQFGKILAVRDFKIVDEWEVLTN